MEAQQSNNPHDQAFKKLLRQKVFAKAFINQHFSKQELAYLDLSTLELWNASFVHHKTETHSDVVYRVKMEDQHDGYIVLLFEHQSTPNKLQAFQVLEYEMRLMRQHLNQGRKKLPVIMTAVFYHGKTSPYPYSTDVFDCFESPKVAKEYYLQPFKLIDVKQLSDKELKKNIVTAPLQIIMKHIRDNDLLPTLTDLVHSGILNKNAKLNRGKLLSGVLEYAISIGKIPDKKTFDKLLLNQPNNVRDAAMTISEMYRQEGMQQGMQQGEQQMSRNIARRMLTRGEKVQIIAADTGLTLAEIKKLKEKVESMQN